MVQYVIESLLVEVLLADLLPAVVPFTDLMDHLLVCCIIYCFAIGCCIIYCSVTVCRISLYVTDDAIAKLHICDVKFSQIEGNGRKLRHIQLSNSVISYLF